MTDGRRENLSFCTMENSHIPKIISADRLEGGVIVSFEDGRCAIYSAALMYATLSQAREVTDKEKIKGFEWQRSGDSES